ncbi:hypothetical protein S7711_05297 [Stachybotrys chartarum IBT 7711]|uniref:Protein kinase domain-containing protein n=1 Tax=Stachybotrys chartarum (strain CBS 109288 / IBT 7711) TaxID=1280523 RepID=A0A084ALE6_STACB|nr:hypothetical protein S7711_05297 [Stachybotrys chartarum IBT 7711]KFA50819.1 hypothetical protein S40293_05805 [Stachybotrys chartarum IBT 40293]
MAAELVGTTIGVVGVLGQLFDGCVKAYHYFTAARELDADGQRLLCKVRIEEMRLVVWGREWGVAEGRLDAHLDGRRNPQLRLLATQILRELHGTVTDFAKLKERYGLVDGGGGADDVAEAAGGGKGAAGGSPVPSRKGSKDGERARANGGSSNVSGERSWRKEFGLRAKWVIGGKPLTYLPASPPRSSAKAQGVDFNDGLERLFPPSQLPSFQRAWTHQLLESAQRDVAQLSLLETASTGVYPQLTASATLKKLRINLDARPQSAFKPTFALKVARSALDLAPQQQQQQQQRKDLHRCQAVHESVGPVVVEWVDYDKEDIEGRVAHVRRLDDLARMMHSASSCHPDLHTIDCVGYTDDAANSRYGLVYKAPAASCSTLHALIASPDLKTPDLNDRVRLAQTLAVALWSLHSLDWLHKSLCGNNILFFPSAFSTSAHSSTAAAALVPDISAPFLVGFDASRPDLDTALSVAPKNPSIGDLHRHPASLRGLTHCKSYDIYSLGLVLLEIGLWKVLQTYYKSHYSAERWRDKVVLPVLVPGLSSKVGRRYKEVVEMCLEASDELTGQEAGELMEKVVTSLESISV